MNKTSIFLISFILFGLSSFIQANTHLGKVILSSGFTYIQKDFSTVEVGKNAKIALGDRIICDNGKTHLQFGAMEIWMGESSELLFSEVNKKKLLTFNKGSFYIKKNKTDKKNILIETNLCRLKNLNQAYELHLECSESISEVAVISGSFSLFQIDSLANIVQTFPLISEGYVQLERNTLLNPVRKLRPMEKVYYKEHLLPTEEKEVFAMGSLDSFSEYLPSQEVLTQSKAWNVNQKKIQQDINIKSQRLNAMLINSQKVLHDSIKEAISEDDFFVFPEPNAVPPSIQ